MNTFSKYYAYYSEQSVKWKINQNKPHAVFKTFIISFQSGFHTLDCLIKGIF